MANKNPCKRTRFNYDDTRASECGRKGGKNRAKNQYEFNCLCKKLALVINVRNLTDEEQARIIDIIISKALKGNLKAIDILINIT